MRLADSLQRRIRFAPPKPRNERISLTESDIAIFEAIHRHGPLPSHYLFEFSDRRNRNGFQHRLTKLYNGILVASRLLKKPIKEIDDETGKVTYRTHELEYESYLVRPPQQFASFHARYSPIVYDLHESARKLLKHQGKLSSFSDRTDPFVHRLMTACVAASIELTAKGVKYIPRSEILERKGNEMELPLSGAAPRQKLVPDDLFALRFGDKIRFFAVEIDRNTESIERKNRRSNSFANKLTCYFDVMLNRTYHDVWGIPNLSVLTVTTNARHAANLQAHVRALNSKLAERFHFKAAATFGANWRVPADLLRDMIEGLTESAH